MGEWDQDDQVTRLTPEGSIPAEELGPVFPERSGDTDRYDCAAWQEGFAAGYAQGAQDVVGQVIRVLRSLGLVTDV